MKFPLMLLIAGIAFFSAWEKANAIPSKADIKPPYSCRSTSVKHKFDRLNGYPNGRREHIVYHVCSIYNSWIDDVRNMNYQTLDESKTKDKVENTEYGKSKWCNKTNSTTTRLVFNCK